MHTNAHFKSLPLNSPSYCNICDAKLPGSSQQISHYNSNKHKQAAAVYKNLQQKAQKEIPGVKVRSSPVSASNSNNWLGEPIVLKPEKKFVQDQHVLSRPLPIQIYPEFDAAGILGDYRTVSTSTAFPISKQVTTKNSLAELNSMQQQKMAPPTKPLNFSHLQLKDFLSNSSHTYIEPQKTQKKEDKVADDDVDQKSNIFLQGQIFNEMEKLLNVLYYSKKVPHEVALKYLKEVNKDIENTIKNCQDDGNGNEKTELNDRVNQSNTINAADISKKSPHKENNCELKKCRFKIALATKHNKTLSADKVIQPDLTAKNFSWDKLSEMGEVISNKKSTLEKDGLDKHSLEIEVLSEAQALLNQIDNQHPTTTLEGILKCLEQFNKRLKQKQKRNEFCLLDPSIGNISDGGSRVRHRYSLERLLELRTSDTIQKPNPQLEALLRERKIWVDPCKPNQTSSLKGNISDGGSRVRHRYSLERLLELRTSDTIQKPNPQLEALLRERKIWIDPCKSNQTSKNPALAGDFIPDLRSNNEDESSRLPTLVRYYTDEDIEKLISITSFDPDVD